MSWLSSWLGTPEPEPDPSPEELRERLLAATRNPRKLASLCKRHQELIRTHFESWRKVPEEIRVRPELAEPYMQGLVAIAQSFEHRLRDASLMQLLLGPPGSNPIENWRKTLDEVQKLQEESRHREAAGILTDLIIDVRHLRGSGVDAYLPVTLGELGLCWFQCGEAARSIGPTRQALEHVRRLGDLDGIRAYLGNLYEAHRYLELAEPAAGYAEELAAFFDQQGDALEAGRYRRQARLVRSGEPRNRVIIESNGKRYEQDEALDAIDGRIQFFFERNKLILRPAEVLMARGRAEGEAGRNEAALELFRDAARSDPLAPHPPYEASAALMYLERVEEAVEELRRTEELAPGWFHCRSELWLGEQVALGRFSQRAYLLLRALEGGGLAPEAALRYVKQELAESPDLPHLHLERGRALRAQPAQAIQAFRQGLRCVEDSDTRTRLLTELAALLPHGTERTEILQEAIELGGNLVAQATARILVQASE